MQHADDDNKVHTYVHLCVRVIVCASVCLCLHVCNQTFIQICLGSCILLLFLYVCTAHCEVEIANKM